MQATQNAIKRLRYSNKAKEEKKKKLTLANINRKGNFQDPI